MAITISGNGIVEANLADNAVTLAKMASGTDGEILTYDASGNPVAVSVGTDGQVLTSTGAGSPPAFETAAGGKVLQVVTAESQTAATTTANAWAASAITASITPSATSSKVLVLANFYTSTTSTSMSISYTIFQDGSTNLGNGTYGFGSSMGAAAEAQGSINVVSSPSTTSAVAYKVYFNRRDGAGTSTCGQANRKSVITLMEIAG